MYVAHKNGADAWLIPDAFRAQFHANGFTRFEEAPRGVPEVSQPTLLIDALSQVDQAQRGTAASGVVRKADEEISVAASPAFPSSVERSGDADQRTRPRKRRG